MLTMTSVTKAIGRIVWMGVSYGDNGQAYFLGLTHNQGMEAFISLSALGSMIFISSQPKLALAHPTNDKGEQKNRTVGLRTVIPVLSTLLPPAAYLAGIMWNGLENPGSIMKWALYQPGCIGKGWKAAIRTAACFGMFYLWRTTSRSVNGCGPATRTRDKHELTIGKYRVVRHPFYSVALIQGVLYIPMFWSYASLASLAITAVAAIETPAAADPEEE